MVTISATSYNNLEKTFKLLKEKLSAYFQVCRSGKRSVSL